MKNFSRKKTTFTPAQLAAPGLPQAAPYEWFPCDDFTLEIDPESLLPTEDAAPPVVYDYNTLAQLQCLCRNEATRAQMHQWGYLCIHFDELYFYHSDYLGHTEYITDAGGYPYQFFYYSPFGESLVTQKAEDQGAYNSPYRFNAKELDEETGNYYYGARYYTCPERHCRFGNPKWSLWLGVDPLAHKYPSMSSYVFTGNNPVMLVDPDGRKIVVPDIANRSKVNSYLTEQFGKGVFAINNKGEVVVNKKQFKQEMRSKTVSQNRKDILKAFRKSVNSKTHIAEIFIFNNESEARVEKNPKVWSDESQSYEPLYMRSDGEAGIVFNGTGGRGAVTVDKEGLNTLIIIGEPNMQFEGVDPAYLESGVSLTKTESSPSSLFIHEVLDHFYEENIKGKDINSNGVIWHNRALENLGLRPRTGEDHD